MRKIPVSNIFSEIEKAKKYYDKGKQEVIRLEICLSNIEQMNLCSLLNIIISELDLWALQLMEIGISEIFEITLQTRSPAKHLQTVKLRPTGKAAFPRSHGNLEKTGDRSQDIWTILSGACPLAHAVSSRKPFSCKSYAPYPGLCWLNVSEQASCLHIHKPTLSPHQPFSLSKKKSSMQGRNSHTSKCQESTLSNLAMDRNYAQKISCEKQIRNLDITREGPEKKTVG